MSFQENKTALGHEIDRERMVDEQFTDPIAHARNESICQLVAKVVETSVTSGRVLHQDIDDTAEEIIKFFYVKEWR